MQAQPLSSSNSSTAGPVQVQNTWHLVVRRSGGSAVAEAEGGAVTSVLLTASAASTFGHLHVSRLQTQTVSNSSSSSSTAGPLQPALGRVQGPGQQLAALADGLTHPGYAC
jgi:hypothetical protein